MKKFIGFLLFISIFNTSYSQNEGRLGIFAGMNQTTLSNADDKAQGDYLPTFKPTLGVSAGYHFTLFKKLPTGFTFQGAYNRLGQNYRGYYADSTDYWAYSRLNYLRFGLGWHLGTNPRRLVSLTFTNGISLGLLANYQERYELVRYNNDRIIVDIKNTNVIADDTLFAKGTISAPLYKKTDLSYFTSLGLDFLLSKKMVFGITLRMDMGLSPVENITKFTIYYNTEPTTTAVNYQPYNRLKYRAAQSPDEKRADTKNMSTGVALSLKYRIYNEEKHRMYYKEHRHDWY